MYCNTTCHVTRARHVSHLLLSHLTHATSHARDTRHAAIAAGRLAVGAGDHRELQIISVLLVLLVLLVLHCTLLLVLNIISLLLDLHIIES